MLGVTGVLRLIWMYSCSGWSGPVQYSPFLLIVREFDYEHEISICYRWSAVRWPAGVWL